MFFAILEEGKPFLALPGSLLAGILLFYLILLATDASIPEAKAQGLLLGANSSGSALWQPFGWPGGATSLSQANWPVVAARVGGLFVVALAESLWHR